MGYAPRPSSWPAGFRGGASTSRGSTASPARGIFYGASRSEAPNTHGLDVHIIGAGNSAGQAAVFFSTHARSVTILYRGDGIEKSM
jgi:thioredoxin reductase